jgi:uncharacterized protein (TIGR02598 family)
MKTLRYRTTLLWVVPACVQRSKAPTARAFTLIEIIIALGVISFALIGLLGLLPAGLQTFRSTMNMSACTQIAQRIATDVTQTAFDTLIATPAPQDRYFDDQGSETNGQNYTYQARVRITSSTELPVSATTETNSNLATVQILVVANPAHLANPYSLNSNLAVSETATFVARD